MPSIALLTLLAVRAEATPECEALCHTLDAVEERCEDLYGDGHDLCEAIGTVESTCDPDDGGTTATCDDLCPAIGRLHADCDAAYGASDAACQDLGALATDCADGHVDDPAPPPREEDDEDEEDDDEKAQPARRREPVRGRRGGRRSARTAPCTRA